MLDWWQTFFSQHGYEAIFLMLFLNNLGIPLPANTMLLGAGLLVGQGILSLWSTVATATAACFMGTNCSYWLGRKYGSRLLEKIHWLRLTHERVRHLERFFKRYGSKGVFFARFVGLLHPVIGILAGMGQMPGRSFFMNNLAGSVIYSALYTLAGDYFGQKYGFHNVWKIHTLLYVFLLILVIILLKHFLSHSIHSFLGYSFYKRKDGGFW